MKFLRMTTTGEDASVGRRGATRPTIVGEMLGLESATPQSACCAGKVCRNATDATSDGFARIKICEKANEFEKIKPD
jgi:hypothetical protein